MEVLESGVAGESPRVWAIRYRSEVPAQNREEIVTEAFEVWATLQPEADAAGATVASVVPANLDRHEIRMNGWHPILYTYPSFDFTFEKDASGSWKHVPHAGVAHHQ